MKNTVLTEQSKIRRSSRTASRIMGGKVVVVVIDDRKVHTLNPVGSRVWNLADGKTLASIVEHVAEEFDVSDANSIQADIETFVQEMCEVGALEVEAT